MSPLAELVNVEELPSAENNPVRIQRQLAAAEIESARQLLQAAVNRVREDKNGSFDFDTWTIVSSLERMAWTARRMIGE